METLSFFIIFLVLIYVMDTNSKVKTLYRKIYHEDKSEKENVFNILSKNIGKTIQFNMKESYAELGQLTKTALQTTAPNEVKILGLNQDWVSIEVYADETSRKIIRLESIASIEV